MILARLAARLLARSTSRRSVAVVSLLLASCSGLGGEPRIVATFPPATRAPEAGPPSRHPDLAQGAALFAENCTRCHGVGGQGDGELVLTGQLAEPPPDFTDPASAHDQTPMGWFEVVTNGRIDRLMPPWRNSLSEEQRWAVTMYSYTLRYSPDAIEQGEAIWAANCALCHGDTGAGDGPRASDIEGMTDLAAPGALVNASDAALVNLLAGGADDVHDFGDTLGDAERQAVIAYARTLSLENADAIGQTVAPPAATADVDVAAAPETRGIVRGRLTNGTADGEVVAGIPVTLRILDRQLNQDLLETTTDEDGRFVFEDVPIRADRGYIATTSYQDRLFSSDMLTGEPATGVLELPITVFEVTDDPAAIAIDSFITQISGNGNRLEMAQILTFTNRTDRVFSLNERVDGGRYASVRVPLPPGAQLLSTAAESDRFVISEDGTALIDTQPVYPGRPHIVHVIYALPYEGDTTVQLAFDYRLEGPARLMVEPESLQVTSEHLPPLGRQTMGNAVLETYGADLSLAAGEALRYAVSGSTAAAPTTAIQPNNLLPYVLIAAGSLSLLAAAVMYYLGRRLPAEEPTQDALRQMLIEQIASLDDLHEKGQIDPQAYAARREKLKARLSKLMEKR